MDPDGGRSDRPSWAVRGLALAAAPLVVGPGLGPGFVLVNDMVFVPRQYLTADALGLGPELPRAVPADAVLAVVTAVVPGDLVQKAVLLAIVVAAITGAARLVRPLAGGRVGPAAVAGLVYGWSPFVAERLLMGHWSLLVGYAALPWVARAALAVRAGRPRSLPRLVLAMAPAALVVTGGLLAAGVAIALGGRRRLGRTAGASLVLALPWAVAGALHPTAGVGDPDGVAAFAARADGWSGVAGAVLGGGGIWNAGAVPGSRTSVLAPVLTVLLVALACYGAPRVVAGWGRGPAVALLALGGFGLLLACAGTVPGSRDALAAIVAHVPGGGVLRDGQKWAAWWLLALAVGAGAGAARLVDPSCVKRVAIATLFTHEARRGGGAGRRGVLVAALLLPVLALPDLAWGVGGRLVPVAFPDDWARVRDVLATDPHPGAVLALPFSAVRAFGWNADRPQLDPAPRFLARPVVVDDALVVGRPGELPLTVAGEDPRARAAAAALDDPAALGALGVGWVLVEHGTPGPPPGPAVAELPQVVEGHDVSLLRVPQVAEASGPGPFAVSAVLGAYVLAAAAVLGSALALLAGGPLGSALSTAVTRVTVSARRARGRRETA